MRAQLATSMLLIAATVLPASAEPLKGGVTATDVLQRPGLQALVPKTAPVASENCSCFRSKSVSVVATNDGWELRETDRLNLPFGQRREDAFRAASVINFYGLDQVCSVGSSAGVPQMQYFLANGSAPQGPIEGEDAIRFDPSRLRAEQINGSWKVTEGDHWMLDFGPDENAARQAVAIINKYGFTHVAYVGRPGAPFMYFRK